MKKYIHFIFIFFVFIPFASCEDNFSYDMEGEYLDIDSLNTVFSQKYPGQIIGGWYTIFQNPTRKVGISLNNNFRLEDKEGNSLFNQVDLSKTRIYEVVNGEEIMQYNMILYPNQSFTDRVPPLEPLYSWSKDWDDERIYDFYKSNGIHFYTFYGVNPSYKDIDFLENLAKSTDISKIHLDFYHQVTQNHGKYIIRWNDQWSDEVEIEFNWVRAKYRGKIGYMPYQGGFKKIWLNGKVVLDIDDEQYINTVSDSIFGFSADENVRIIDSSIDIVCVH